MKEGWEYKKLGEVCNIEFGTRVVRSRDAGSIYPVYGGGGATFKMDMYNREDCMVISRFGMSEQCTRFVKGKFFLNDSGLTLSMKENCMIQEFMDWQILYLNNTIYSLGRGAAQKNLDTKALADVRITYPHNLSEQQSFVDYLDSAFAKIDAMKANAEKRLNEAKALFQASLKKMLEPKEGWEEKSMKEIVHPDCSLSYGIVQPGEHIDDGVPVVRPVDFNNKVIVRVEGLKRTKKEISDAYKRTILKGGEILLCVRGTTGTMGLASDELQGCNVTRGIVPIFFDEHANKMFVYYQLLSPKLQTEIQKKTTGAALKQINIKDLRALHLFFPSLSEQQAIVETLDSLKSKVDRLQANYEKISQECDALKQAILRQVFE